jgi:hypothetical protein
MALYEITWVKTNGQTETRYTDTPLAVGESVMIDGSSAKVVSRHPDTHDPGASGRFVCEQSGAAENGS